MIKVFVYGSLRKGLYNHEVLTENGEATFLGEWQTPPEYKLYDLGMFPVVCKGGDTAIKGEVYEVDDECLAALDMLEGYPDLYQKTSVMTEWGKAVMYYMRTDQVGATRVPHGDWVEHVKVF